MVALLVVTLVPLGLAQARPADPAAPRATTRGVIVQPGAASANLARLRRGDRPTLGGQPVRVEQAHDALGVLVSSAALGDAELAQALTGAGYLAEPNRIRQIQPVTPTAELFNQPATVISGPDYWHVERVNADLVHAAGTVGLPSVIVGVVDTGVDITHPILAAAMVPGMNFLDNTSYVYDDVGHGTHVAGIVHSICPHCSLMPLKVLDYFGGDDYTIARGILYAQEQGAKIVQISLGGPAPSATLCRAVRTVEQAGALVVIAAGNSAASAPDFVGYPALCSPDSLVVAATDRYDRPAWFSNYGEAVDIAAPGLEVWSTVPSSFENSVIPASGTSMAAPMVSGGAALLWAAHPAWTAAQVRAQLLASARDISTMAGIDDVYGLRLDLAQAFGLRPRPIVTGVVPDVLLLPKSGTPQQRTVHVRAVVRGDAIGAVTLRTSVNGVGSQAPMTLESGDTYVGTYLAPPNTGLMRSILVWVVAGNNAGTTASFQELVVQDGVRLVAPSLRLLTANPQPGQPVSYAVEWNGSWSTFDLQCDVFGFGEFIFSKPKGQTVSCTYPFWRAYYPRASLFDAVGPVGSATLEVRLKATSEIYLPFTQ